MRSGVTIMRAFNQRTTPNGRRTMDLIDNKGSVWTSVNVMSGVALPLNVPVAGEVPFGKYDYLPAVVVGYSDGDGRPIVLGGYENKDVVFAPYRGQAQTENDRPVDEDDMLEETFLEEVRVPGPRSTLAMRQGGRVVVAGTSVHVQVPTNGFLRVSQGGDSQGRVALADPLVAYINDLAGQVNYLKARVEELQSILAMVPIPPGTLTAGLTPVVGALPIRSGPIDGGKTMRQLDGDTVASLSLRVSKYTDKDADPTTPRP